MNPATASNIIDRAVLLKDGGAIVIPCSSYEEMEALRLRLYKLRSKLEKKHSSITRTLDITRKVGENRWTLFISKEKTLPGVLIIEDGEAKPFTIETEENKAELQRLEDFDEAAAKIEAMQGLSKAEEEEISRASEGDAWNEREKSKKCLFLGLP